jgi:signal transduction histidine kinase
MSEESDFAHTLKNQLAIILGYADLLLADMPPEDPRYDDLQEIHKAAVSAVAMFDRVEDAAE